MFFKDFYFLLPELYFIITLFVLFCFALFIPGLRINERDFFFKTKFFIVKISPLWILFSMALYRNLWDYSYTIFDSSLISNNFVVMIKLFILFLLGLVLFYSYYYEKFFNDEFLWLIFLSFFGLLLIVSTTDFILFYLNLELQSLAIYVLVAYNRNSLFSTEAALKYFILGALSSSIMLLGLSFLYFSTGTFNFLELNLLFNEAFIKKELYSVIIFEYPILLLGILLLLIGFSFKLSIAPFHFWTPDIYQGASTLVLIFIATIPKISLYISFFYFFYFCFPLLKNLFETYFICVALASLLVGTLGGLYQNNFKRLIAYSSILNVGFIGVALSSLTWEAIVATVFYFFIYSMSLFFLVIILMVVKPFNENINFNLYNIFDLRYLVHSFSFVGVILAFSFFSLAGLPPLAGFINKFYVLYVLSLNNHYFLIILSIIMSVISSIYYVRLTRLLFFDKVYLYFHFKPLPRSIVYFILIGFIFNLLLILLSADLIMVVSSVILSSFF